MERINDQRDIDALVDFIEGEKEKEARKKKKKKKRKSNLPENVSEAENGEPSALGEDGVNARDPLQAAIDRAQPLVEPSTEDLTSSPGPVPRLKTEPNLTTSQRTDARKRSQVKTGKKPLENKQSKPEKPKVVKQDILQTGEVTEKISARAPEVEDPGIQQLTKERVRLESLLRDLEKEFEENEETAQALILDNHFKLNSFQKDLESSEDRVHENNKSMIKLDDEISDLNHKILELQRKVSELSLHKDELMSKNESLKKDIKQFREKRIRLETEIDKRLAPLKDRKCLLSQEIGRVKEQLANNTRGKQALLEAKSSEPQGPLDQIYLVYNEK